MSEIKRTPRGGGGRDWAAYNAAHVNEKRCFLLILAELTKEVEEPERTTGRRPFPLRDAVFCVVLKVYSTLSARRFKFDLGEVQSKGLIQTALSPASLSHYMRCESLYNTLQGLLVKSSLPLSEEENVFAADSTGFGVPRRRAWFNKHTNRHEKRRDYVKLHVVVGVKTNIITYAEVTEGTAHDGTHLRRLVEGTARYFDISELSADAGYLSAENMHSVLRKGGIPYFAFRKNCALDAGYKSTLWKDLLYLWKTRHPVFTERYFLRNNVEATFHAMKAKFGGRLLSKSTLGQFNEALAKALCHNVCVLIRSMHEMGIDPLSWSEKMPRPRVEGVSLVEAMAHRREDLLKIRAAAGDRVLPLEKVLPRRSNKVKTRKRADNASAQISLFD